MVMMSKFPLIYGFAIPGVDVITWSRTPASANGAEDVIQNATATHPYLYLPFVSSLTLFTFDLVSLHTQHVIHIDIKLATTAISSFIITIY